MKRVERRQKALKSFADWAALRTDRTKTRLYVRACAIMHGNKRDGFSAEELEFDKVYAEAHEHIRNYGHPPAYLLSLLEDGKREGDDDEPGDLAAGSAGSVGDAADGDDGELRGVHGVSGDGSEPDDQGSSDI